MSKKGQAIVIFGGSWAGYPAWINLKTAPSAKYTYIIVVDETFHHDIKHKHQLAFEAVVVSVQYQMENGRPIFDV